MGSAPSISKADFRQKYLGKTFTREDFLNPKIFNFGEVSKYVSQGSPIYNQQIVNLVDKGVIIVENGKNLTLAFDDRMSLRGNPTIYIHDNSRQIVYEISYAEIHYLNGICLKVQNTNKQYKFSNMNQVQLYFDDVRNMHKEDMICAVYKNNTRRNRIT
jgi:hypothetical protein